MLELLRQGCRKRGQRLLFISGTGELDPHMAQAGDVPPDVLQAVTTYSPCGGPANLIESLKFVSDRLLLSGYGADAEERTRASLRFHFQSEEQHDRVPDAFRLFR